MTSEVILHFMKNLRLHNVSIHRNFYQNRFINECARKKKAKIPESQSPRVPESRSFLVRYRRTYVLNNIINYFYKTLFRNKIMDEKLGDSRNKRKGLRRGNGLGKDYSNYVNGH